MVCPHYGSITCKDHGAVYQEAGNKFEFSGVPSCFVTDSQGNMVSKVAGSSPQKFIDALNEAQQKIGKPPLRGSQIMKYEGELIKGDRDAAKAKFKAALKSYQKVAADEKAPEFIRARANDRLSKLGEAAMTAIQEAQGMEPAKAKKALKKLAKEFKGLPDAAKAAQEALAGLEG